MILNFNLQDFITLPIILIIGIVSSYTDIKTSRIPNWLVFTGMVSAIAIYLFLFFYNLLFVGSIKNNQYILESIINALISLGVGFFIWKKSLWSAGDAKLFAVYAALLPLHFYSKSYVAYFPSFNLLINLFLPLILILIAKAMILGVSKIGDYFKTKTEKRIDWKIVYHKTLFSLKKIAEMFPSFLFMMAIWRFIDSSLNVIFNIQIKPNVFLIYFVLVLVMRWFSKFKQGNPWVNYVVYLVSLVYVGSFVVNGQYSQLFKTVGATIAFMMTVMATRYVLALYIKLKEVYEVRAGEIKRGTVIYEDELQVLRKTFADRGRLEEFGETGPGGVKDYQVTMIRELFKDQPLMKIRAYRTFSFAPFLLFSVIIATLTQGSFLNWFGRF